MEELSTQAKALEIHNRATSYYSISEQYAFKFLMELKVLRDEKLFLQLDCKDFEDYASKYFGMSSDFLNERINIASKFGESQFNGNYQKLGHSKSLLIARTTTPSIYLEQAEIVDMSVKALKEKIKAELKVEQEEEERKRDNEEQIERVKEILENEYENTVKLLEKIHIYDECHGVNTLEYEEHTIDDNNTKENIIFMKIALLAHKKYVKPTDEEGKEQRKKALMYLADWYNTRQLKAKYKEYQKHKKLYEEDESYRKYSDDSMLLQKCNGDYDLFMLMKKAKENQLNNPTVRTVQG